MNWPYIKGLVMRELHGMKYAPEFKIPVHRSMTFTVKPLRQRQSE